MKCCGLGRMLWPCPGVALDGRDRLQPEVLLPAGPRPGEKAESPALLVPWLSKAGSLISTVSAGYLGTPVLAALGHMVRDRGSSLLALGGLAFSQDGLLYQFSESQYEVGRVSQ